jgi:hypothetical protein
MSRPGLEYIILDVAFSNPVSFERIKLFVADEPLGFTAAQSAATYQSRIFS